MGPSDKGATPRCVVMPSTQAGGTCSCLCAPGRLCRGRGRVVCGVVRLVTDSRRMRSRLCVADNAVAVTGRNLGDEYFSMGADSNFLDIGVLAVGQIVMDLSASFDMFWNCSLACP